MVPSLFSGRRITLMPPLLPVGPGLIPTLYLDTGRGAFNALSDVFYQVSIMSYPLFILYYSFFTIFTHIYTYVNP